MVIILGLFTVAFITFEVVAFLKWDTIIRRYREKLRSRYQPFEYYGIVCDKCKEPGRVITKKVMNGNNCIRIRECVTEYRVYFKYYEKKACIIDKELYDKVKLGDKMKLILYFDTHNKLKIVYFEL